MTKHIDRQITFVVIATGISSVVTQLVVIREFLSQFSGNEFVIALILFSWLLLGGIGTFIAKIAGKKATPARLAVVLMALAVLSPIELMGIRLLRDVFFIFGSSVSFYQTFSFSFLIISPYCLLLGFSLPYSLVVAKNQIPSYSGTKIYIIDNIGDVLGGVLFSFFLIFVFTPFQAIGIASILLLIAAWCLYYFSKKFSIPITIVAAVVLAVICFCIGFEHKSLSPHGTDLVYYKESRYGRIEILKDNSQYTLFLDGKPIFSNQNLSTAEETIHYPLSQLDHVNHILMISAEGGVMTEIEKYHPQSVDYVELDPTVSDILFRFGLLKKIPGLNVIHKDGRAYLKQTDKKYNAIIVNLPEPDTFQINRFYTDQFFKMAKNHLTSGGILSFSVEGFENYLTNEQIAKISSLYLTVRKSFSHVLMLPGQKVYFLCADKPLNDDIPKLLEKKGIDTKYIRGFYYGNLTEERIKYLNDQIHHDVAINYDYTPQLIQIMYKEWFEKFSNSPTVFIVAIMLLFLGYSAFISREEFLLFSTGFMLMGSEILVIFVFQICFGYIYQQIGIIVTVFLAGLFPGAAFGETIRKHGKQALIFTEISIILLLAVFIISVTMFSEQLPSVFFILFGFMLSIACGCQFPIALFLRGSGKQAVIEVFSADLIGAAFGVLITSVVLIPFIGIVWSAVCLTGFKLISFIVIETSHENI